jgi:hypothetical protein
VIKIASNAAITPLSGAAAAVAAMFAGRNSVNAVLEDAGHWLNYFVHVHFDY